MITIIGAGPGGCYAAYLLAKKGAQVQVIEEHPVVGRPVACTGIITAINKEHFTPPDDIIVNRIKESRIIAPNGQHVQVKLKNDVILDRDKLDQHLAKMAREAGATFLLEHRFVDARKEGGKWHVTVHDIKGKKNKEIVTDILVGADGPLSRVAKATGLYGKREFYAGMQVTADIENSGYIEFYPTGTNIAWLVPENRKRARIGVAAKENVDKVFKQFMTRIAGPDYEETIVERQAGLIPLYNPKLRTAKDGVYLVGDAATTVKAPTLGGINQAMIGAKCLAQAIISGKDYEKLWKKEMGRDLQLSLWMRSVMNKFSDAEYDKLVEIFSKEKNRKILEQFERDAPSRFALKLALQEPALWPYARHLL